MMLRLRRKLGFVAKSVRSAQLIRGENREKRVAFCKAMISEHETFDDVVFVDESTVQLENNSKTCYLRKDEEHRRIKSRAKHPVKVHVWAGISSHGATPIVIFDGRVRMDSKLYCKSIRDYYIPFAYTAYGGRCRLAQDNDPKHISRFTLEHMDHWKIKRIEWPPESPDLNPIEFVWHQLKHFLRHSHKPKNKDELVVGIKKFWRNKMTKDQCKAYVGHIAHVIPKIIRAHGGNILE
ncbi:hypothetical protein ANCCAN_09535 [Ancylostoma caninum]|uniref:Tc1-like transposase DDE domain-containing protein n=1 Tax=Ancylostoma caninum TaxID=29170 RepID=A0A368GLC9_ANCCA|nr:hypothetical protein ANCCAN_09535 [Ancylostoma caninum]